jgi:hypothetical protein
VRLSCHVELPITKFKHVFYSITDGRITDVSYLSYMLYQLPTAAKCNPHRMVFRFALRDPVAFEGVMTVASHHMASVNRVVDPSQKLRHLTRVVGLVNQQIDKNSFTDETIYAVGALACIEVRFDTRFTHNPPLTSTLLTSTSYSRLGPKTWNAKLCIGLPSWK